MSKLTKALTAAAGNAGSDPLYAEDVFSTYLWEGTNSANTIENGIDLAGEGGLVWSKWRSITNDHMLVDTERGALKVIKSNSTGAQVTNGNNAPSSFLSNGFTYTDNGSGYPIASWTFRKAEKFFDVVTWTGTGGARTLSHNLGSTPSVIIVKSTTNSAFWCVYHSSLGATKYLQLSSTVAAATASTIWNDTAPTSTEFTVGAYINQSQTYVAYLFASDAGGFGDDGDENIIKCGSFSYSGSEVDINLGFEPQFFLYKASNTSNDWEILDVMRAWGETQYCRLNANESAAEACYSNSSTNFIKPYANGVKFKTGGSGRDYIYIAIRRPMKTPESGTEVFSPDATTTFPATMTTGFPVDLTMTRARTAANYFFTGDRLRGNTKYLSTATTNPEAAFSTGNEWLWDANTTITQQNTSGSVINYNFKRATGFMDVVVPTATQTLVNPATEHTLGVVPEFIISKSRDSTAGWFVYHSALGLTKYLELSTTSAFQVYNVFGTTLTSTQFQYYSSTVGESVVNYLFATLAGVSKVGSYTGTGSNLNVDCGFSAGARFILIKRTDSTGDWYVWDTERGITAGNDPYLLLNSTAAEVTSTDYIDPLASGFTVTSSAPAALNASGGSYIFLAIA